MLARGMKRARGLSVLLRWRMPDVLLGEVNNSSASFGIPGFSLIPFDIIFYQFTEVYVLRYLRVWT